MADGKVTGRLIFLHRLDPNKDGSVTVFMRMIKNRKQYFNKYTKNSVDPPPTSITFQKYFPKDRVENIDYYEQLVQERRPVEAYYDFRSYVKEENGQNKYKEYLELLYVDTLNTGVNRNSLPAEEGQGENPQSFEEETIGQDFENFDNFFNNER